MLTTIKSEKQYETLYNKYVSGRSAQDYINYFMDKSIAVKYIQMDRLQYAANADELFLFFDEGDYYSMFFIGISADTWTIPSVGKDICCDIFEAAKLSAVEDSSLHRLFFANGFTCEHQYEQMRFCYGKMHNEACAYIEKNAYLMQQLGLEMGVPEPKDKREIEQLVATEISPYDKISLTDTEWTEQIDMGNIICAYKNTAIAAVYVFTPQAGRIIVKKEYRGKKLSIFLRMYFAAQPRWKNSPSNQYDVVECNNVSSKKCLEAVGAVCTGKIKYRYIKRGKVK